MISFFVCLAILILGHYLYSKLVEKIFAPELDRMTPSSLFILRTFISPLKAKGQET